MRCKHALRNTTLTKGEKRQECMTDLHVRKQQHFQCVLNCANLCTQICCVLCFRRLPACFPLALFSSQNRAIRPFALLGSRTRMTRCLTGHDRESVPAVGAQVAEFWLGLHPRHETCANAWTALNVCNSNCRCHGTCA